MSIQFANNKIYITHTQHECACKNLSNHLILELYQKTRHLAPIRKYKLFVQPTGTSGIVIIKCVCLILRELKKKRHFETTSHLTDVIESSLLLL